MTPEEYLQKVLVTETMNFDEIARRFNHRNTIRLTHAVMGMSTEANEALDVMKKHIYYSKPTDITNLVEEIGDCLWYIAIALDVLGVSFSTVMEKNIAKLQARYGSRFTNEAANTRNLDKELEVLKKEK